MIPRPVQHGGGVAIRLRPHIGRMMGRVCQPNAAHETRSYRSSFATKLSIMVHDSCWRITPSWPEVSSATVLAMATMAQCHDLPRINTLRSNK